MKGIYLYLPILGLTALCLGCAERPAPAPVIEVYQGKSIRDVEANSYKAKNYQVQQGDTLYSIAWQSGQDYRSLAALNEIRAPYAIYPGQVLKLAKKASSATPKKIRKSANHDVSQTIEVSKNQTVDPPTDQAYRDLRQSKKNVKRSNKVDPKTFKASKWNWPTQGKVIKEFSLSESGNKGIDISNTRGTSIIAAADGKVVYTGDALRGYGNLIIIKHSEEYLSAYAHNEQILVKEQQWVQAGTKIATMGSSGATEVKLHFEVRYKGKSVNPLRHLPAK